MSLLGQDMCTWGTICHKVVIVCSDLFEILHLGLFLCRGFQFLSIALCHATAIACSSESVWYSRSDFYSEDRASALAFIFPSESSQGGDLVFCGVEL